MFRRRGNVSAVRGNARRCARHRFSGARYARQPRNATVVREHVRAQWSMNADTVERVPSMSLAACASTLLEAATIAGGVRILARRLRVPLKQLTSWIEGDEQTPRTVLLRAIDFLHGTGLP